MEIQKSPDIIMSLNRCIKLTIAVTTWAMAPATRHSGPDSHQACQSQGRGLRLGAGNASSMPIPQSPIRNWVGWHPKRHFDNGPHGQFRGIGENNHAKSWSWSEPLPPAAGSMRRSCQWLPTYPGQVQRLAQRPNWKSIIPRRDANNHVAPCFTISSAKWPTMMGGGAIWASGGAE